MKVIDDIHRIANKLWWTVIASGIVGILFGLASMIWPHLVITSFIYLFSLFVIAVSIVGLAQSLANIKIDPLWWLSVLFTICGVSIGVFVILNPDIAKGFLAVLLAIFIFSQALLDLIVASYTESREDKFPLIAIGIIGVVFGFVVLMQPRLATEAMMWVIGLYILIHGAAAVAYALRIKFALKEIIDHDSSNNKARKAKEAE